jgi:hypothetical protein
MPGTHELPRSKLRGIETNIESNYFNAASCGELDPERLSQLIATTSWARALRRKNSKGIHHGAHTKEKLR